MLAAGRRATSCDRDDDDADTMGEMAALVMGTWDGVRVDAENTCTRQIGSNGIKLTIAVDVRIGCWLCRRSD